MVNSGKIDEGLNDQSQNEDQNSFDLDGDVVAAQHRGSSNDTTDTDQYQDENQKFTSIVIKEVGQLISTVAGFPKALFD